MYKYTKNKKLIFFNEIFLFLNQEFIKHLKAIDSYLYVYF